MKLSIKELINLLIAVDSYISPDDTLDNKPYEKLCIKLAKEINKRGYKNIIVESWLKQK